MAPTDPADAPENPALERIYDLAEQIAEEIPLIEPTGRRSSALPPNCTLLSLRTGKRRKEEVRERIRGPSYCGDLCPRLQ